MIAVLDYGIGNLRSAEKALQRAGAPARLVADPEQAAGADGIVVPGVGSFGACMNALRSSGLDEVVVDAARRGLPLLGICVGFQMLFECSEESPHTDGLGVMSGRVVALAGAVKHPQMQWNVLDRQRSAASPESAMLAGLGEHPWVYFVHSFAPVPIAHDASCVVATCDYGGPVVAACERGAIWGCQFHPEKSGEVGLSMLRNFARRCTA